MKKLGLDIGSTTIKCVLLDENDEILYSSYERHLSKIAEMTSKYLKKIADEFKEDEIGITISGSAGLGISEYLNVPFTQEVFSTRTAVQRLNHDTDVVIELGGEDAKILFFTGGFEARMNGSCAGGTGAFIDQMAALLNVTQDDLNLLAKESEKRYTIASRCGVFAKSDIQPLLNQGASVPDIAASILKAVVNQTVGGLAQGREIEGNILYLGGPLTYFDELRKSFDETLGEKGVCPENSLYYVAIGAALQCNDTFSLKELAAKAEEYADAGSYVSSKPLFASQKEYEEFCARHEADSSNIKYIDTPDKEMYLGIDAGSTTVKAVITDKNGDILNTLYCSNHGNPVEVIKNYLTEIYEKYPGIGFAGSAVTGYGEEIIKHSFGVDTGIVETIAHYIAAKRFMPEVDFIIDIGGQDIKCFKIHNQAIDNIFLNEACSSGCGSFLQTFAEAMHYSIEDFAKLGLFADRPVDLGSRCTVFMNSSVKQAQKDGASVENISAGLSMSVVKNALYKVIRCGSVADLGKNIVVQGGTFLNDAVLRAFEQELDTNVVRPNISGIMGAYGAALYAIENCSDESTVISAEGLAGFEHSVKNITCKGCNNHCRLTVNSFGNKNTYIAGNRCSKPLNKKAEEQPNYNLYEYKRELLKKYRNSEKNPDLPTVGIPLALNMYELLPFWHTFFTELKFNVIVSPDSNRKLFLMGQHTIPSDTVCYPAKLLHGHMEALLKMEPEVIFYPCMSYNLDEEKGDNHYNCPVVAYYPEVANVNIKGLENVKYIHDFVGIHNKKAFPAKFYDILKKHGFAKTKGQIKAAMNKAFEEYENYMLTVQNKAQEYIETAKSKKIPIIILAGRPYHIDPEINHGIDKLICELGAAVISEDGISGDVEKFRTTVLNQWTYHSRLYLAAKYVAESPLEEKMNLVQFVSFGCGVDAVTSDEVRSILEDSGKIYTQLKIDEVANGGAAKIRLRSLFAATKQKRRKEEK